MTASPCPRPRTAPDDGSLCGGCGVEASTCRREVTRRYGLDLGGQHVNDIYGGSLAWNTGPPWGVS